MKLIKICFIVLTLMAGCGHVLAQDDAGQAVQKLERGLAECLRAT